MINPLPPDKPWGSIMRGQRREFDTMMPLSMLKLSTGRPAICHMRILTGSPRVALREKTLEQGMPFSKHRVCHSWMQSCDAQTDDICQLPSKLFIIVNIFQSTQTVCYKGRDWRLLYAYLIVVAYLLLLVLLDTIINILVSLWGEGRSRKSKLFVRF